MITPSRKAAAQAIIGTDNAYFDLAAAKVKMPGAELVYMKGLERLASASVVHRINPAKIPGPVEPLLDRIEDQATTRHLRFIRIYLAGNDPGWTPILQRRSYSMRQEELMFKRVQATASPVALTPVRTRDDWRRRIALFQDAEKGSDGHAFDAEAWNDLERRKAATGNFHCLVAHRHGQPVGCLGYLVCGDWFRAKNIFVCPDHRKRGIATNMLRALEGQADRMGMRRICLMAINPGPALKIYRRLGYRTAGHYYEWSKMQ